MSRLLKINLCLVGGWVVALAVVFILPVPVIAGLAQMPLSSLLIGSVLLTLAVISLDKDKDKILWLLAILLVAMTMWLAMTKALEWGAWVHFKLNRGWYEAKVMQVLAAGDVAEKDKICGKDCWAEDSQRITFRYVTGFLNWFNIVYDPKQRDWEKKPHTYFRRATHISGDWYLVHQSD